MSKYAKLKTGEAAPDLQVVNAGGETISLSSIWADRPVVLTFLRHFG
jgi:peroxiredoxin